MEFTFYPNEGVNNLRYGMDRVEIRNILTLDKLSKEFYRSKNSKNSCDEFYSLGIFINYDENNNCDSFEFFQPAKVMFAEVNLMELSYLGVIDFLGYIDANIEEDDSGCTSFLLGVGAYAPFKSDEPNNKIESIITFKRDYYNQK